ncbi:SH2 domain-containing protein [Dimargaris cristalligena]|uniref:Transcription elongation factor Spt6 n=1 Tax=Dimargaris cristalligena TaxID=215637 RepID=A0A4P9ZN21_9FUNG|nr:SH2 domain-containing protein [Dimargaris cristalligena]|eukprot:RKP34508.1 SH2 domain-containing protein [Dimargaris cristalligena]
MSNADFSDDLPNDDLPQPPPRKVAGKRPVSYSSYPPPPRSHSSASGSEEGSGSDVDSEEEEDDDDEAAVSEMRQSGFIVDDEDEDEEDDLNHRSRHHKKRHHRERSPPRDQSHSPRRKKGYTSEEEQLDDEDLALMEENLGYSSHARPAENKLRRLQRGRGSAAAHREPREREEDLSRMFDEEEDVPRDSGRARGYGSDEDRIVFDDENDLDQDELPAGLDDEAVGDYRRTVSSKSRAAMASMIPDSIGQGLDPETWQNLFEVFGDGTEYDFALEVAPPAAPGRRGARAVGGLHDGDDGYGGDMGDGDFPEVQLKDIFEPAELEHKLMTDRDNIIRARDIPERMQIQMEVLTPYSASTNDDYDDEGTDSARRGAKFSMSRQLTDQEVEEQTEWVLQHLRQPQHEHQLMEYTAAVINVCRFIGQDFLEVPFIAANRQDYLMYTHQAMSDSLADGQDSRQAILNRDDLWSLFDLDIKFRTFVERKHEVAELVRKLERMVPTTQTPESDTYPLSYIHRILEQIQSVEEVHDLVEYLHLIYGGHFSRLRLRNGNPSTRGLDNDLEDLSLGRAENGPSGLKRPQKHVLYEKTRRSPVAAFAARAAMSSQHFATNYCEQNMQYFPESPSEGIEELAAKFISSEFGSTITVSKAAKAMLALEIAYDPLIRRQVRMVAQYCTVVSVEPTRKGEFAIDNLHPYYPFKFLRQKPVAELTESGQFLSILKGEQDGLLSVHIGFPPSSNILDAMIKFYESTYVSETAQKWNAFRREILQMAYKEYLLPLVEKYSREWLRSKAEEWAGRQVQAALERKLNVKPCLPYRMKEGQCPRVLSLTSVEGKNARDCPVMWAMLDSKGQLVESGVIADLRDPDNAKLLMGLLEKRQPDVVGIAGSNLATKRMFEDVSRLVEEYQVRVDDEIRVTWVDDEVARLYRDSPEAHEAFSQLLPAQRYCVSIGRVLQNALAEYAGVGKAVRSICHHPLQPLLSEDVAARYIERAFVNITNDVGVDVNLALQFPHHASALQYVAGLGPRKVTSFLKRLEATSGSRLDSRAGLILNQVVTRVIFMNCASFLRVVPPEYDVLDDTRIHPEDYELARKMATDALEVEVEGDPDDDNPSLHVEELMRSDPEKLNELLLEDYAQELEKQLKQPKLEVLRGIKRELQHPFADHRAEWTAPTVDRVFTMLTGETDLTLWPNQVVVAVVQRVRERFAMCKLDSDLDGFLPISRVMDERIDQISDYLVEGQALPCVVVQVHKDKCSADLSTRDSDLAQARQWNREFRPELDRYFDREAERQLLGQQEREERRRTMGPNGGGSGRPNRMINHPLFKPMRSREAEAYLDNRPIGDVVIRPSSRGNDHIAITWKVCDGVYQHVDVKEEDKESDAAVGRRLRVSREDWYSDLDELLASHIEPMAKRVEQMLEHPKYEPKTLDEVSLTLRSSCNSKQKGDYAFILCASRPGWFELVFMSSPQAPVKSWKVQVCPNSYKLGETAYTSVGELINGFKRMQMNLSRAGGGSGPSGSSHHSSSRPASGSGSSYHRSSSSSYHPQSSSSRPSGSSSSASSHRDTDRYGSSSSSSDRYRNQWDREPTRHSVGRSSSSSGWN